MSVKIKKNPGQEIRASSDTGYFPSPSGRETKTLNVKVVKHWRNTKPVTLKQPKGAVKFSKIKKQKS